MDSQTGEQRHSLEFGVPIMAKNLRPKAPEAGNQKKMSLEP